MDRPIRIGTRGSPLALAQAQMVADALRAAHGWGEDAIELVPITTTGDVIQNQPLSELGGKGLWTKELDRFLAEGETDLSVHSMKDVETIRAGELTVAAMLPRADPRDRLIGAERIADLAEGAIVGTSSPRRVAQLRSRRPDLRIVPIRGNVQTRLAKIERGEADATLLAAAGLDRVGLSHIGRTIEDMIPAPSQGAIGIETRTADEEARALAAAIDHAPTHRCVAAERAFLKAIGGDCRSAVAALATLEGGTIRLRAEMLAPDGSEVQAGELSFGEDEADGPAELARTLLGRASPALRAMFTG